jgi:hypothetical protein
MDLAEVSVRSRAVGEVAAKAGLTKARARIIAMVLTNGVDGSDRRRQQRHRAAK